MDNLSDHQALVSSAPSNHRTNSDDGTGSRKAMSSHNSTPDMTHTNNDEQQPKLSGTTNNPFVPDGALAASPLRDQLGTHDTGLPHPFADEYSAFDGQQQYYSETSPGRTAGDQQQLYESNSDAPTALVSDASYNGNPFVASSDDERTKQKHVRRVKASSPPATVANRNASSTTPGGTKRQQQSSTSTSVQQYNDFEDDPFGIGAPATARLVDDGTINGAGATTVGADPFAQVEGETALEKNNTALHDDPFTDEGYYRTLAAEAGNNNGRGGGSPQKPTPEPQDDPFAHFGTAPFDANAGRNHHVTGNNDAGRQSGGGSILRTDGSILRRQSQYGPQSVQKQQDNHLGVGGGGKPRRQSVAVALSQAKPKSKAEEFAGPIDVVSTMPIDERKASSRPQDDYSAEEVASVDKAAEQLFMPSMKREQYIPVRVAREKIKLILSEMAQMKLLHLSAIDTMEKQHQFLKAQLETACAAYCRKLTSDYNNRVVALNNEYKKRLAGVGTGGARGGGGAGVLSPAPSSATSPIPALVPSPNSEEDGRRIQLLEEQLAAKQRELDVAHQTTHECLERADDADEKLKLSREEVRKLKLEVERLQQGAQDNRGPNRSPPPPGATSNINTAASDAELQQKVWSLESELHAVRLELDNTISVTEAESLKNENRNLRNQVADLESQVEFHRHASTVNGGGGGVRGGSAGASRNILAADSAYDFS
ncbi:Hypothetical protein, putative [Bodo saltans]|uniref:Uncharacterized protein n=1 Tax=Bodo saltans TaxID=75058 RepID=A0A0S4IZH7_BODSA|nr:Hypothetical protein, putative [Bodo saltans]|eukprot:CUG67221.1 Hypothetical protein, putative [Bodo saltans]